MKSYSDLRTMHGELTNQTATSNLDFGSRAHNDAIRQLLGLPYEWGFLEDTATETTVASQDAYQLPYNIDKLVAVTITVGTTNHVVYEAKDQREWNELKETDYTSDIPELFYVTGNQIEFYPTPSSNGNTITFFFKKAVKDLANADYTTGTVTGTNGSTGIEGAGTTFTDAMVGRFLKLDDDGYWYEIASFTDADTITLRKEFQGTTAAGASYTIGEMPVLPEAYHDLPAYYGAAQYWMKEGEIARGREYLGLWEEGKARLIRDHGNKTANVDISDGPAGTHERLNPNLYITL